MEYGKGEGALGAWGLGSVHSWMSACAGSSHSFCHLLCLEFILHIHFVFCHQGKDQRGTRKHRVKKPEEEREGERREREKLACKAETVQAGNTEFTPPGLRMHNLGTASMKESLSLCNFYHFEDVHSYKPGVF